MKKKLNLIDIGVLLILVVFILGIGIRLFGSASKTVNDTVDIEYTVVIENVRKYSVDALKKSNILTEDKTAAVIGEIVSVDAEGFQTEVHTTDGELQLCEVPDRYKCTVVLKSPARKMNDRYFVTETAEISVGKTFDVITKYVKSTGTIMSVTENAQ